MFVSLPKQLGLRFPRNSEADDGEEGRRSAQQPVIVQYCRSSNAKTNLVIDKLMCKRFSPN